MAVETLDQKTINTRLERKFEVVLYYVVVVTIGISYLPLDFAVNHLVINVLAIISLIFGIIGYRLLPTEHTGRIFYTFSAKSLVIIMFDLLIITLLISFSGAAHSPFYLLYIFPILAASILLERGQFVVSGIAQLIFYFAVAIILNEGRLDLHYSAKYILILIAYLLGEILLTERIAQRQDLLAHQEELVLVNQRLEKVIEIIRDNKCDLPEVRGKIDDLVKVIEKEG